MLELLADYPALLLTFPLTAALVGWATNWLAVRMTFRPIAFIGIPPFLGWQGVVPRNAERMAHLCIDQTLSRFGNLQDIYERLDPALITGQVVAQVGPRVDEYIDEIMYELQPVLWDNAPAMVRRRIYRWARARLPARIESLVADFGAELGELVDLKELLSEELRHNPDLMNRVFEEAGAQELNLLVRSGWIFGGLLGLLSLPLLFAIYSPWLLMGLGFAIGFLTNWLALNLIFRPLHPRRWLGHEVQGLFLRRQVAISRVWSRIVAEELLTVERVAHAMIHGRHAARTRAILQKNLRPLLDQSLLMKLVAQVSVGMTGYTELKKAMNEKAILATDEVFHDPGFNRDRSAIVASAIHERVSTLPPDEFQAILRPAFQEEEWRLMWIGGFFGLLAGAVQAWATLPDWPV